MKNPEILDTTLRDGEQSPGVYFTLDQKVGVAVDLDKLGVEYIEAGIPSMGKSEQQTLSTLSSLNLDSKLLTWNRLLIDDVVSSLKTGINNIHVSIPASSVMLEKKLGKDINWVLKQIEDVITFSIKEGLNVSLGAEDASRSRPDVLKRIFSHAFDLGAERVRYADTLGILTPLDTYKIISELSKDLKIPLDFHGHNDFGMATANALAAWEGGAQVISCSILGLGERAGNTHLEEFIALLHYLKQLFDNYDFIKLKELCEKVSLLSGLSIAKNKPIFGESVYTHESGIHIDGILKDPSVYEFFSPEKVGGKRNIVSGKHSGKKSIRYLAKQKGYNITDDQISEFLNMIREKMLKDNNVDMDKLFDEYLEVIRSD